jgi:membrane protease subunit (stomatin/prohibitin family)
MAINIEDFRSAGVLPTGPCSAWPQERNHAMMSRASEGKSTGGVRVHYADVKVGSVQMARNLAATAKQAMAHGKVASDIREERMETCRACPHFIEDSKRCSECGCYMEAKSWVGGNPKQLCPKKKWKR